MTPLGNMAPKGITDRSDPPVVFRCKAPDDPFRRKSKTLWSNKDSAFLAR